jgi:hypothetical protein
MNVVNRSNCYKDGNVWCVDSVPVATTMNLNSVKFIGMGQTYQHKYKNGNEETRWKLVDSISPRDDIWFLFDVTTQYNIFNKYRLVIKINNETINYELLTYKSMRVSQSNHKIDFNVLEVALIESELIEALGNDYKGTI